MAAGTKIFLAVLAIIAVGGFVYYATIPRQAESSPPGEPADTTAESPADQGQPPASILPSGPATGRQEQPADDLPPARPALRPAGTPSSTPPAEQESQPETTQAEKPPAPSKLEMGSPSSLGEAVQRAETGDDKPTAGPTPQSSPQATTQTPLQATTTGAKANTPAEIPKPAESKPTAPPTRPMTPRYTDYLVKSGDTMSSIAAEWFGDAGKWDLILRANPTVKPEKMQVGQKLRLPPRDASREALRPPARAGTHVHVVSSGENLSRIAEMYYGDADQWRLIYEANERTIGPDPDTLTVGAKLTIPPAPRDTGGDDANR